MIQINKTPEELYILALQCHYVLKDYEIASEMYRLLIARHPQSIEAGAAALQLDPEIQPTLKEGSIQKLLKHALKMG